MLPSFRSICHLQYANFMLQAKNTANEATDRCVQTFEAGCHMAPEANAAVYVKSVDLLYLAWWAVTQRTSKMTELSKFKGSFKGSFK